MSWTPWRCAECGAETVEQGWSFYAPMNLTYEETLALLADQLLEAQPLPNDDSYWCPVCEDECSPIREVQA